MIQIPVEAPITEFLHTKAAQMRVPINGTFELTPVCNMSCRMCYVRKTKQQQEAIRPLRSAEEWIQLGKAAQENGLLFLLLTGGEPFLRPDFKEIFQALYKMGLVLSINSNGTLIDEETIAWLKETPPARINITLYGASNETYGRLCGNPDGFTQVTNAIRLLKEANIMVKLNCSVTPYNADDLEEIIAFAKQEGLVVQATSYMFPPLRRDASMVGTNDRFTPEDAAYYAAKIESLQNGEEAFLEHMKTAEFPAFDDNLEEYCGDKEGDGILCRAGKCSFWITWEGKMLPCGMLPGEGIDVFQNGFASAWKTVVEDTCHIRLPGPCKDCPIKERCRVCAAMAYTENGDFTAIPKYRCQMAREYPDACRKLESQILEGRQAHET